MDAAPAPITVATNFRICVAISIPHPITAPEKFLAKPGSSPYYKPSLCKIMPADPIRQSRQRERRGTQPKANLAMKAIFGPNWKTTQAGIAAIGSGLALLGTALGDGAQISDLQAVIEAVGFIGGGIGLIFARDRNVTSEQSGVK